MERLTNHFSYCECAECKYYDEELAKCNKCKIFITSTGHCHDKKVWEKLRDYEDLEEQGLLLKLPCKVGDTYWELEKMFWVNEHKCKGCKFYFETLEDSFCDCDNDFPKCTQILEKKFSSIKEIVMNMDEINKTIFLTKEEAEKALERLECAE